MSRSNTLLVYSPFPTGGMPWVVRNFLAALAKVSELRIVWPVRPDFDRQYLDPSLDQPVVIPMLDLTGGLSKSRHLLSRLNPRTRSDVSFFIYALKTRPTHVLLEEVPKYTLLLLVFALRILRIKVIIKLHNVRRHDFKGSTGDRIDELQLGLSLKLAHEVVVHSASQQRDLVDKYGISTNVTVMHHGVESPDTLPFSEPDIPTFLFYGVNRPNKGIRYLADAVKGLGARSRLVVAGHTPTENRAETEAALDQIPDLRWIDRFVEDEEVPELMAQSTALVMPYVDFFAQSGVLNSAIGFGVPVVVSDVGGMPETVRTFGIGLVVPPGDVDALKHALIGVADPAFNARCRENSIEARDMLSYEAAARIFVELLT
jgi:glycosyltransferase involved in cell wall biosynthesis